MLHISQPGRLGALMKVQEGQDQPGWGGGDTAAAHLSFQCPHLPWALAYLQGTGEAGAGWLGGSGRPR